MQAGLGPSLFAYDLIALFVMGSNKIPFSIFYTINMQTVEAEAILRIFAIQ